MKRTILIVAGAVLAAVVLFLLTRWRKAAVRKKQNQEQIDRKLKEDTLDRALSNGPRPNRQSQSQAPVEVHYKSKTQRESGTMLRLTEQAESVTKEYLFQRTDTIYIGEEYGHAAIFQDRTGQQLCCELFPYEGDVYVRLCGKTEGRLIRGRQTAPLTTKAIRLRSGDRIETRTGVFLVELI